MAQDDPAYTLDIDLANKPVTRVELWRAMAMLRRQGLDLHILMMALKADDIKKIEAAGDELDRVGRDIDEFMDKLLDVKPTGGASE